jgi:hypothetical protein
MTEAAKSFIDEIAARYGIRIGRDDPIMMVYTLLEEGATEVLNESRKLLSVFQEASSSLFSRELAVTTQALELAALARQVKTDIATIQRFYKVRIAVSLMCGLAAGLVIGTALGLHFH